MVSTTKTSRADTQMIQKGTWKRREFRDSTALLHGRIVFQRKNVDKKMHTHISTHTHTDLLNTNLWKIKPRYSDLPCLKIHQVIISLSHLLLKAVHCT